MLSKKLFALFVALSLVLTAGVANALSDNDEWATYNITYTLEEAGSLSLSDTVLEETAGGNIKRIYQLPNLSLTATVGLKSKQTDIFINTEDDGEVTYEGDKISYEWTATFKSGDKTIDTLTATTGKNADGDTLIVSGVLPDSSAVISIDLVATIISVDTSIDLGNFPEYTDDATDQDVSDVSKAILAMIAKHAPEASFKSEPEEMETIEVELDEDIPIRTITSGDKNIKSFDVKPADGVLLNSVDENYVVTVNAYKGENNRYQYYIASSDNKLEINLPTWLVVKDGSVNTVPIGRGETAREVIVSFDVVYSRDSDIAKGTKGRVRVKLEVPNKDDDDETETYLQWDVVCNVSSDKKQEEEKKEEEESVPFGVFGREGVKKVSLDLVLGASSDITLSYKGTAPVSSFETSGDSLTAFKNIGGKIEVTNSTDITKSESETKTGSITLRVTAPSQSANTTYSGSLIFYDANNNSSDISIDIKVNTSDNAFKVTASPATLNLTAGGSSQNVVISSNHSTASSWEVTEKSGLTVSPTRGTSFPGTLTISAPSTMSAGKYTVTVSAQDGDKTEDTANITVEVSANITPEDYDDTIKAISDKIKGLFDNAESYSVEVFSKEAAVADSSFSVATLSDDFEALDPAEVPVIALNSIDLGDLKEAIYVFPLSYDVIKNAVANKKLIAGEEFFIHMIPDGAKVSSNDYGRFFDNTGAEIMTVPASENSINIAACLDENNVTVYRPVISKYKLTVSSDTTSLSLEQGYDKELSFKSNKTPSSWNVSADSSVFTVENLTSKDNTLSFTLFVNGDVATGTHNVTVNAYDADGTEASLKVSVTVTQATQPFGFTVSAPSEVNVTAGGAAQSITLEASGKWRKPLTWSVTNTNNGITFERNGGTSSKPVFSVSAASTAKNGTYPVSITATDETDNVLKNINVIVTGGSSSGGGTSGDSSGGGGSGGGGTSDDTSGGSEKVSEMGTPSEKAKETFSNSEKSTSIVNAIAQRMSGTIPADVLAKGFQQIPDSAMSDPVELSTLISSGDQDSSIYYLVLNTFNFTEAGLYYCTVPQSSLFGHIGYGMNCKVFKQDDNTPSVDGAELKMKLAATETNSAVFTDDEGNVITTVPEDCVVNIGAYFEAGTYSPVIEIATTSGDIPSSGAGCNGGFGALIGLLAMAFTGSALYVRKKEN